MEAPCRDTLMADAAAAREILVTEMENAVKLKVALKVGVAEGDNWYDCH